MNTKDGILFVGSLSCNLMSFVSLPAIQHRKTAQSPEIETSAQNQQKGRKRKILQEWEEIKGEIKLVNTVMFAGIAASKPVIAEHVENFLIICLHPHAVATARNQNNAIHQHSSPRGNDIWPALSKSAQRWLWVTSMNIPLSQVGRKSSSHNSSKRSHFSNIQNSISWSFYLFTRTDGIVNGS